MGLQIKRPVSYKTNLLASVFAIFALVVQPMVALNLPSVFAAPSASVTVGQGGDYATLQEGIDATTSGGTISILSNITTSAKVDIKNPVTINGNGNSITAIGSTTGAVIEEVGKNGVVINNLVIDGGGKYLHPFKTYKGNATLNNVTLKNSTKRGLLVNSAVVTVNNIRTEGNTQGGIEVAQGSGSSVGATLTVTGTSSHAEIVAIRIDNRSQNVTVNDLSNQYIYSDAGAGRTYTLKPAPITPVKNLRNGKEFTTIQLAIDDIDTDDNDTIEVSTDGTFAGFTVAAGADTGLTIKAATGSNPVIEETTPSSSRVVDLRGISTTVEGFTIRSLQPGNGSVVYLDGDDNVVRNNTIVGNASSTASNGIFTAKDSNPEGNNTITGNTIISPRGINLRNTGNIVKGNDVTSTVKSLSVEVEGNTIEHNNFYNTAARAVESYHAINLNVEENWWGQDTGPDSGKIIRNGTSTVDYDPWLCEEYVGQASPRVSNANGSCAAPDTEAPTGEIVVDAYNPTTLKFESTDNVAIHGYAMAIHNENNVKIATNKGNYGINTAGHPDAGGPTFDKDMTDQMVKPATYGSPKVNIATLPDGKYTVKLSLYDTSKNQKNGISRTFIVDHAKPRVDSVTAHFEDGSSNGAPTHNDAPTFIGFNPESFDISASDSGYAGVDRVGAAIYKQKAEGGWNYLGKIEKNGENVTVDLNNYATYFSNDGTYRFVIYAYDKAGNRTSHNVKVDFTKDKTAPEVSDIVLNGQNVTSPRAKNCGPTNFITVNGEINLSAMIQDTNDVDNASYKIYKVNDGGCTMSNPNHNYGNDIYGYQSRAISMVQSGNSWTTPSNDKLDTGGLAGRYTIALTTKDSLGNSVTRYVDLNIDNSNSGNDDNGEEGGNAGNEGSTETNNGDNQTDGNQQNEDNGPEDLPERSENEGLRLFAQAGPTFPGPTVGLDADEGNREQDVLQDSVVNDPEKLVLASEDNGSKDQWSLANLLLSVVVWATTIMALAGLFGREQEERNATYRWLTLLPSVGAAAIIVFVENFGGTMGWVDVWTIPLIVLAVIQVILLTKARSTVA